MSENEDHECVPEVFLHLFKEEEVSGSELEYEDGEKSSNMEFSKEEADSDTSLNHEDMTDACHPLDKHAGSLEASQQAPHDSPKARKRSAHANSLPPAQNTRTKKLKPKRDKHAGSLEASQQAPHDSPKTRKRSAHANSMPPAQNTRAKKLKPKSIHENGPSSVSSAVTITQDMPSMSKSSSSLQQFKHEIGSFMAYGSEDEGESEDDDMILPMRESSIGRILAEAQEEPFGEEQEIQAVLTWPPEDFLAELPSEASAEFPSLSTEGEGTAIGPDMFHFEWRGFPSPLIPNELRREPLSNMITPGPTTPFIDPYEAFTAIWDRPFMEYIANETNRYAVQVMASGDLAPNSRIRRWKNTDAEELYRYFAVILATGTVVKSRLEEYWTQSNNIFCTPGFKMEMPYNRFLMLNRCIHFVDNASFNPQRCSKPEIKLFKVQPLINHLNHKFSTLYVLDRNIALDESLTMWKGSLNINQFIRNKVAGTGIKTYEVCESQSGYLWRFKVHTGSEQSSQDTGPLSGSIPTVVLGLLKGLEFSGRTVWMDNFYNSPALARQLKALGLDCVGTLRLNRQFVPVELMNLTKQNMAKGQISGCTSGDVDLVVWRDQNRVALISTYHGPAVGVDGGVRKPNIVSDYNICMGGVDKKDQILAMYPIEQKRTRVWYKKFFKRLLNVSVLNAHILHSKSSHTSLSHRNFRHSVVLKLLEVHKPRSIVPHHNHPRGLVQKNATTPEGMRKHVLASQPFLPRGKERLRRPCQICNRRTTNFCADCDQPMCKDCFEEQHE